MFFFFYLYRIDKNFLFFHFHYYFFHYYIYITIKPNIMNIITTLWNWLNGKKTVIGAVLLFISSFLTEVVLAKWHVTAVWVPQVIDTLNWIGMAITGLGLTHKAIKSGDDNSIPPTQVILTNQETLVK